MKKWALLKDSDGGRGAAGKSKIYEIVLDDNVVKTSWGMAEKSGRARATKVFFNNNTAYAAARVKLYEKLDKGYHIAYEV